MTNEIPTTLDWVSVRATETLSQAFERLRREIEEDVRLRNHHLTSEQRQKLGVDFIVETLNSETFVVHRAGVGLVAAKEFKLGKLSIEVSEGNSLQLSTQLVINQFGRVKLSIEGTAVENWQVRHRALDSMFFSF